MISCASRPRICCRTRCSRSWRRPESQMGRRLDPGRVRHRRDRHRPADPGPRGPSYRSGWTRRPPGSGWRGHNGGGRARSPPALVPQGLVILDRAHGPAGLLRGVAGDPATTPQAARRTCRRAVEPDRRRRLSRCASHAVAMSGMCGNRDPARDRALLTAPQGWTWRLMMISCLNEAHTPAVRPGWRLHADQDKGHPELGILRASEAAGTAIAGLYGAAGDQIRVWG